MRLPHSSLKISCVSSSTWLRFRAYIFQTSSAVLLRSSLIFWKVGTSPRELMRWLKNLSLLPRFANRLSGFGLSGCRGVNECLNSACSIQKIADIGQYGEVHQDGLWHPAFSGHLRSGSAVMSFLARAMPGDRTLKLQHESGIEANMLQAHSTIGHKSGKFIRQEHSVSRDWLAKRWVADKRKKEIMRRRKRRLIPAEQGWHAMEASMQPPISQYEEGLLYPQNPKEVKLVPLLARADLLITRDIEWANIMFAFEQENRYAVVDLCYPQSPVGFIHEQSNVITRQLLRTRRPFIAYIIDAMGNEIFRVRRPFWWITSTIYTEVDGKEVGIVCRRWHLWRRIYDLYLGNKQFAVVENPGLWNWTFTLKDEDDNVLAQIDRDWRGFGLELFTDAGQYVIRFGNAYSSPKIGLASAVQELQVSRPLTLLERAVAVALAISLDNDFFSRTVGGWGLPIIVAGE